MGYNQQSKISPRNITSDISEVYVFGDLLSDTGNLFEITSEAFGAGDNYLRGGLGRDTFILNFNGNAVIEDFNLKRDRIDLAGSLTFSDLDIVQRGNDTAISFNDVEIGKLLEFEANNLSVDNFIETV